MHERIIESDDLIREQCYLVARGVRPLALIGHCESDDKTLLLKTSMRLEALAGDAEVIPFVVERGDGWADYGYAAAAWVLDLFQWAVKNAIPPQRDRIIGLMLGYGVDAVRAYEEQATGRRFVHPVMPAPPASN